MILSQLYITFDSDELKVNNFAIWWHQKKEIAGFFAAAVVAIMTVKDTKSVLQYFVSHLTFSNFCLDLELLE